MSKLKTANNPLKLLIFHRPWGYGGTELYVENLVRYCVKDDMIVYVCMCSNGIIPDGYEQRLISYGAKIISINFDPIEKTGIIHFFKLWTWFNKINPDVVFLNRQLRWNSFFNALIISRLKHYTVISTQHYELPKWPVYPPRKYPPRNLHIRDLIQRIKFKCIARLIDAIICLNQLSFDRFIYDYGFPKHNLHVVYHGIDTNKFAFNNDFRNTTRQSLGLNNTEFVIISIARHSLEKGVDILVEAISLLPLAILQHIKVVLVGNGPEHMQLKELTTKFNLTHHIMFLGERFDTPQLLSASDLFVCTSRLESFGLAIAEAMAAGRTVIGTLTGGIPDVIGDSGILIPPESPKDLSLAIKKIFENPAVKLDYEKKALERVSQYFTIEKSMRNTIKLIRSLVNIN